MRKKEKNEKNEIENDFGMKREFKKYAVGIAVLIVITFTALVCSLWNTANIRKTSDESTEEFFDEITWQKAETIINEIDYKTAKLRNLADSLEQFGIVEDKEKIIHYLDRKKAITQFETLVLIDSEKKVVFGYDAVAMTNKEKERLISLAGVEKAFAGDYGVDYLEDNRLAYTVPILSKGEIKYVLCGVSLQKSIQKIEKTDTIFEKNITCIINHEGDELFSLKQSKQLGQLHSAFKKEKHEELKRIIQEGGTKREGKESGTFRTKAGTHGELLVGYDSLGINDWFLLTIVPADLFTGLSETYTLRMNLIIGVIFLIFLVLFYILHKTYEIGRKEFSQKAFFDDVTGGINNTAFRIKFQENFAEIEPMTYSIVMLDIKDFKLINEKFGTEKGDYLLQCVHQTIRKYLHAENKEFCARSEMDHFFICMRENREEIIQFRLDEIMKDVNLIWKSVDANHPIVFRQAAYVIEDTSVDIRRIQDRTRMALRKQPFKSNERCVFYVPEILDKIKRNHKLDNMFEDSIRNHDFEMYLQPKIELGTWKLKGAEALVRWKHPKEGMIYPSEFIPLFEKNGKIEELDLYMFEEACKFLEYRQRIGMPLFSISVNLSRDHFQVENFLDKFVAIADRYRIPRNLIEFELTERLFLDEKSIKKVQKGMHEMHELGFLCSIDDFGTGYSSLGLLKDFEIDVLKLDRLFFEDLSNEKSKNIIKSVVQLAKDLEVQTVAEGIETLEQLDELKEIPCNLIQGYIFSKPLPVDEFEKWESEFCVF